MTASNAQDRHALVLGASSGLGRGIAIELGRQGMKLTLAGRSTERLAEAAKEIPDVKQLLGVDLTDSASVAEFCDTLSAGEYDIVILNAGGPPPATAADVQDTVLRTALEMLVVSQIRVVQAVLPQMIEKGWGRIVSVGSSGVVAPIAGLAYSNAARSALVGYLKTLAGEVAGKGVTVNTVLPGRIGTPRVAQLDEKRAEKTGARVADVVAASHRTIPAGRYGRVEEFAAAVSFLCAPEASYITGSTMRVDGGMIAAAT